jgi:hypothetical protein
MRGRGKVSGSSSPRSSGQKIAFLPNFALISVSLRPVHLFALWPLAIGYLLAIDKDITEYRRQFRHHFPAKSRLDPKVDNLHDDPINPS